MSANFYDKFLTVHPPPTPSPLLSSSLFPHLLHTTHCLLLPFSLRPQPPPPPAHPALSKCRTALFRRIPPPPTRVLRGTSTPNGKPAPDLAGAARCATAGSCREPVYGRRRPGVAGTGRAAGIPRPAGLYAAGAATGCRCTGAAAPSPTASHRARSGAAFRPAAVEDVRDLGQGRSDPRYGTLTLP